MCRHCGRAGVFVGMWYSYPRRLPWKCYECQNDACEFEFQSAIDGRTLTQRPNWMVPQ